MFGSGVECWAIAEFYRSLNIDADGEACASARSFNYICGCSDTLGYAGANNKTKQAVLAWLPRVGAILSILVRNAYNFVRICLPSIFGGSFLKSSRFIAVFILCQQLILFLFLTNNFIRSFNFYCFVCCSLLETKGIDVNDHRCAAR